MSEAWATTRDEANGPWFELKAQIARDGWSPAAARQLALVHSAYLAVQRPFSGSPKPPRLEDATLDGMLVLDVEYPHLDIDGKTYRAWPAAQTAAPKKWDTLGKLLLPSRQSREVSRRTR
jgi:hypothetical protein